MSQNTKSANLRYGVINREEASDPLWMLRQFRSSLEEAKTAEIAEAQDLVNLGWDEAEVAIVSFDSAGFSHFEGYRDLIGAASGEVFVHMRQPEIRLLDIERVTPARKVRKVLA